MGLDFRSVNSPKALLNAIVGTKENVMNHQHNVSLSTLWLTEIKLSLEALKNLIFSLASLFILCWVLHGEVVSSLHYCRHGGHASCHIVSFTEDLILHGIC